MSPERRAVVEAQLKCDRTEIIVKLIFGDPGQYNTPSDSRNYGHGSMTIITKMPKSLVGY